MEAKDVPRDIPQDIPRVVHLQRSGGEIVVGCDIYIGRGLYQGGWRLGASKWANPYKVDKNDPKSRKEALARYESYVRSSPQLVGALPELRGKALGCWCSPAPCHGDILIKLFKELVRD